ncbi:Clampless protein 1 [Favolaschia claudopus]|uniref:Clampless protein 1 n=1 Tax=Favolaschia claudopus TaxID=2862362 RepID=A0AAW0CUG0_9AGAR
MSSLSCNTVAPMTPSAAGPSMPTHELPQTLERPSRCFDSGDISPATLEAVGPDLAESKPTVHFIQEQLYLHTDKLLAGLRYIPVPPTHPSYSLPVTFSVTVPFLSDDIEYPTHILAVLLPSENEAPEAPIPLVPIHGIVLAVNCSAEILRPLIEGDDEDSEDSDSTTYKLYLPVCSIRLPSVEALITLRNFMYTKEVDALFADLFPLPQPFDHETLQRAQQSESLDCKLALVQKLIWAEPGVKHLLRYGSLVLDLWRTACCLGMHDDGFWDALDLAWELVLIALNFVLNAPESGV